MLVLQASFLIPPFGYAVEIAALVRALVPRLAAQFLVLASVVAFPSLTHVIGQNDAASAPLSDEEIEKQFDSIVPEPEPTPPEIE